MTQKLWQTGNLSRNDFVEQFTIGNDFIFDQRLLPFDIQASKAHSAMLFKIGILTKKENKDLQKNLNEILQLFKKEKFKIKPEDEDCHTAIENFLIKKCGIAGKKIHTGRSRNDQVLTALRLFLKSATIEVKKEIKKTITAIKKSATKFANLKMPGYTHYQRAMPTTANIWLSSFADATDDLLPFFKNLENLFDQSPLGSAAGFGIANFKNDRKFTAQKMNLKRVQENSIYCGFSRGWFEFLFLQNCHNLALIFSRFTSDLLLFSTFEFDFIKLPEIFTTGSSIMPQKRNPDSIEILAGKIATFSGKILTTQNLISKLTTGYHREFQLLKKPLFEGYDDIIAILKMIQMLVKNLEFKKENLQKAMKSDLFLTEKVYLRVVQGESFS